MKTSLKITVVALIAILFASCSSTSLMKRKYNKGFYFEKSSKANNSDLVLKSKLKTVSTISVAAENNNVADVAIQVLDADNKSTFVSSYSAKFSNRKLTSDRKSNGKSKYSDGNETSASNEQTESVVNDEKSILKTNTSSNSGGDVSAIILILLCLLLPPLAVYLKEGEINNKFWIDLVLCLLFWLPGIIYAFWVCFA